MKNQNPKPNSGRTEAQKAASRANGRKSRGPVTEEGKKRSSMNAFKHGKYARHCVVLYFEDREAYDQLRDNLIRRYAPADSAELNLVDELTALDWSIRRHFAQINQTLHTEMVRQSPVLEATGAEVDPLDRLNYAHAAQAKSVHGLYSEIFRFQRARNTVINTLSKIRKDLPALAESVQVFSNDQVEIDLPRPGTIGTNLRESAVSRPLPAPASPGPHPKAA